MDDYADKEIEEDCKYVHSSVGVEWHFWCGVFYFSLYIVEVE